MKATVKTIIDIEMNNIERAPIEQVIEGILCADRDLNINYP